MGYKTGEIYFVRETDLNSGELSSYVKIGLVAGERSSQDRLSEHQTGNPRRLQNEPVIKTNAGHRVEAQLHRLYAPYRISGEWFDFSDQSVFKAAIKSTEALADEMALYVPKFEKAEGLKTQLSTQPPIAATSEAFGFASLYMRAKTKIKICNDLAAEIKSKLTAAIEAGEDVQGAAETKTVTPAPKFSVTKFKAAHKDLYAKYCINTPTISESFKVQVAEVSRDDLDEEFLTEIASLESDVAKIEQLSDAYLLNLSQLALTRLKSLAQWDFDLAEAELKILCADHEGIEGVCSWLRKEASTSKFDVDTFANENIELWLEFTLPRETYTRLIVNKKKA
jgi:hypothetical protein